MSAARHWTKGHGDDYLSRSAIVIRGRASASCLTLLDGMERELGNRGSPVRLQAAPTMMDGGEDDVVCRHGTARSTTLTLE